MNKIQNILTVINTTYSPIASLVLVMYKPTTQKHFNKFKEFHRHLSSHDTGDDTFTRNERRFLTRNGLADTLMINNPAPPTKDLVYDKGNIPAELLVEYAQVQDRYGDEAGADFMMDNGFFKPRTDELILEDGIYLNGNIKIEGRSMTLKGLDGEPDSTLKIAPVDSPECQECAEIMRLATTLQLQQEAMVHCVELGAFTLDN